MSETEYKRKLKNLRAAFVCVVLLAGASLTLLTYVADQRDRTMETVQECMRVLRECTP